MWIPAKDGRVLGDALASVEHDLRSRLARTAVIPRRLVTVTRLRRVAALRDVVLALELRHTFAIDLNDEIQATPLLTPGPTRSEMG